MVLQWQGPTSSHLTAFLFCLCVTTKIACWFSLWFCFLYGLLWWLLCKTRKKKDGKVGDHYSACQDKRKRVHSSHHGQIMGTAFFHLLLCCPPMSEWLLAVTVSASELWPFSPPQVYRTSLESGPGQSWRLAGGGDVLGHSSLASSAEEPINLK